jgi:DNA polymerase-3 subunit epsilon
MTKKRILFLDTETTGLQAGQDRIIELGIVETVGGEFTHNNLHVYFNPPAPMNPHAQRVHGITPEFLQDKGQFGEHVHDILAYIKGAHEIIIHNALFDVGFLDYELYLLALHPFAHYCHSIKCSLSLARSLHTQGNSLDLLAEKYGVDISKRTLHGSIIDSQILKHVFDEMLAAHPNHPRVIEYLSAHVPLEKHDADEQPLYAPRPYFPSEEEIQKNQYLRKFTAYMTILDDLKKDFDENPYFYCDRSKPVTEANNVNQEEQDE